MPNEELYVGVAPDTRPDSEKARDWTQEEVATGEVVAVWRKKKSPGKGVVNEALGPVIWRRFKQRDQRGGTCVSHSHAKALGIENHTEAALFLEESARPIYWHRSNKPASGMSSYDAFDFCNKKGTTSEARLKSLRLNDAEMDLPYQWDPEDEAHAQMFRGGGYVKIYSFDSPPPATFSIDAVAEAIESTHCGVVIHIFATGNEWKRAKPYIASPNLTWAQATVRHALIAVDYAMVDGKKCLICDESWANDDDNNGQRILSEEFLAKRCRFAGRYLPKPNDVPPVAIKPVITRDLVWRSQGQDVKDLQTYLQAKGFFPAAVAPTGLWLNITAQAVRKWQVSKGLLDFQGSPDSAVRFGPKSRDALAAE